MSRIQVSTILWLVVLSLVTLPRAARAEAPIVADDTPTTSVPSTKYEVALDETTRWGRPAGHARIDPEPRRARCAVGPGSDAGMGRAEPTVTADSYLPWSRLDSTSPSPAPLAPLEPDDSKKRPRTNTVDAFSKATQKVSNALKLSAGGIRVSR